MTQSLPKIDLFKDRLAWAIEQKGLTVLQLSIKGELSPVQIHFWLQNGQVKDTYKGTPPTLGDWLALAYVLGYPVEWLSNGTVKVDPVGWPDLEISGLFPVTVAERQLVNVRDETGAIHPAVVTEFSAIEGDVLVTVQLIHQPVIISVSIKDVAPYAL